MTQPKYTPPTAVPIEWNPHINHNVISLVRQDDGNWKGTMWRNGQMIEVRQISPGAVLEYLLVHGGKVL